MASILPVGVDTMPCPCTSAPCSAARHCTIAKHKDGASHQKFFFFCGMSIIKWLLSLLQPQLLLQALIFISSNYLVGLRKSFRRPPLPSMMMLTLRLSAGSCRVSRMKQSTHLAICPAFGQTTSSPCGISLLLPPALMPRPFASVVPPPGTTTRWDPVIVIRSFLGKMWLVFFFEPREMIV